MSTTTPILGLHLWEPNDRFSFDALTRDNTALESALAALVQDKAIVRSAARINAYNNMKSMRYLANQGQSTPEKTEMFFGNFNSTAPYASTGALHCEELHGYLFSANGDTTIENGSPGDVTTGLSAGVPFSITAPFSGYINSVEVDVKASTSTSGDCYLKGFKIGGRYYSNIEFGMSTTRQVISYTFSSPLYVHKGEVISGTAATYSSSYYGTIYGAEEGVPYIKFTCIPAPQSGWLKSALNELGDMGHSEVRAYIQCNKSPTGSVTATLIDADGNETTMTSAATRNTVTLAGTSCEELEFVASYSETEAQLRIDVDAADGYADIYNYAVIGI